MSIKVTPIQGSYTESEISPALTLHVCYGPTKVYIPWIVEYFLNKPPINTNV